MNEASRVLIVENRPDVSTLVEREVRKALPACEFRRVETQEDFSLALESFRPDLILSEFRLPRFDGMTALRLTKERAPEVPVIIVTDTSDEESVVECMKAGAADYVIKKRLMRLGPAVTNCLSRKARLREQVGAEEAVRDSEVKFRRLCREFHGLLDAIPDSLMLLDDGLKVLWANRTAGQIAEDETPDSLVGRPCYELWYRRETACEPCPALETFKSGLPRGETVSRPDGRIWDLRTIPLADEGGRVTRVIEVRRDVTEQRKIELQLRRIQKFEAIGQLAGGIAHDFNNILNAVTGYAGLLQMKMDPSDTLSALVEEISAAGQRGALLTHQILAFSRKQLLDIKPVNLNDIVRSIAKMLRRIVREDIGIEMRLFDGDLVLQADASQIDSVIINLASNARDAMPSGGRLIISTEPYMMGDEYLTAHGYGRPGDYALLSVSDTGCGMDAGTKERIFEPFFTTKGTGSGTGLGLAAVLGIVKQHGGFIDVYSEIGAGTTVKIYLPLTKRVIETADRKLTGDIRGGAETILIAEDDASSRKMTLALLKYAGYRIIEAVDGEDAILKFKEQEDLVRLVILDGIMPRKNGLQAFDEIRNLRPGMKAIFLSGYAKDIFGHDGLPGETAVFIQKPVKPDDLLRAVRRALDG